MMENDRNKVDWNKNIFGSTERSQKGAEIVKRNGKKEN